MIYYRKDERGAALIFSVPNEYSREFRKTFLTEIQNKEFSVASAALIKSIHEGCCRIDYKMYNTIQTVKMMEAKQKGTEMVLPDNKAGHAGASNWVAPDYLQVEVNYAETELSMLESLEVI